MVEHRHINHNDMRNRNLALILNHLHQNGPMSRTDLSIQTGINKASISTTVRELIERGIVIETGVKSGTREVGHPSINVMINPDAGRVIGVEVEPDCVSAVVSDVALNFLWRKQVEVDEFQDPSMVFAVVREIIREACSEARSYGLPVLGLGLGVPGLVDIDANFLLFAPELGWREVDLNPLMADHPDIRFFTGNEAHMSALGDCYFGTSRKSVLSVYISWGRGVSGGIMVNEDVVPGGLGLAGELGHISLDSRGERCSCGNTGCWNALVNQQSILKRIHENLGASCRSILNDWVIAGSGNLSWRVVVEAAKQGDSVVLNALSEAGRWMGVGIASLINLLNPEFVILGGPLSQFFDFLYPVICAEINERAMRWQRESCHIVPSRYRQDACLVGTIATVLWNMLNDLEEGVVQINRLKKAFA